MTENVPTPLDFELLKFAELDVHALARELLDSDYVVRHGRSSRTLAKSKALTLVLTVIRAGHGMEEHAASGPVMIVPLIGSVEFSSGRDSEPAAVIGPEGILMIGKAEKHRVSARENTAFLIAIGSQSGPDQR